MRTPQGEHRVTGAESSRKLLSTLLCFTETRPTWTVAELAKEMELSVTSTYRYVGLLREVGLLDGAANNAYRVTDLVLGLGRACEAARAPLAEIALPIMTEVRDQIDETVLVARRGGAFAYCVDRVESRRPVRLQFDQGQAMSLHAGSMARVLLAAMNRTERAGYLGPVLPTLPAASAALLSDDALDRTHADGWTESFEEIDEGIWGTAAAIVSNGSVIASIGTAAPIFRSDQGRRDTMIRLMREAAADISSAVDSY